MLKFFKKLYLPLESLDHISFFLFITSVARRELYLLDCHQKTRLRVHAQEYRAERSLANQGSFNPFDHPTS